MSDIRLIDANALLKSLKSGCENCSDANTNWCEHCCKINDFEDLIDNAPTVEPEDLERTGYWETPELDYARDGTRLPIRVAICSECQKPNKLPVGRYCSECGSRNKE